MCKQKLYVATIYIIPLNSELFLMFFSPTQDILCTQVVLIVINPMGLTSSRKIKERAQTMTTQSVLLVSFPKSSVCDLGES